LTHEIITLFFFLVVIIAASELFTNAIETLGERLGFSEGVTGSIFAAVGTALPETMVPLVAIFGLSGGAETINEEVGVGAILGAPFMLSTLAFLLAGASAWYFQARRGSAEIKPERSGLRRDVEFFLFSFTLAFLAAFTPYEYRLVRVFVAIILVLTYFYYVLETVKASAALVGEGHATEGTKPLYLSLIFKDHMAFVLVQVVFALVMIIAGAKGFVHGVEALSTLVEMPVIALSVLIVPVATELPEKLNSIIWIRKGKDTMAIGNITGAMVFQGSLLPAIGIFLTPWTINLTVLASSILTIIAAAWIYLLSMRRTRLLPAHLLFNGLLYAVFVAVVVLLNSKS